MKKYNFNNPVRPVVIRVMAAVMTLCVGFQVQARDGDVSGVVRDAVTGRPLMGVRIGVAGKSASAVTDSAGVYSIRAESLSDVLIVGAPDYTDREIPLQGRRQVDVRLYASLFSSGYGNIESLSGMRRKTSSAQAASEAAGFWSATPMSVDAKIQDLLGGDVRAVTRTGVAGAGAALFIRGLNSLNASAQPLFTVDGVIWDNQSDGASIHKGYFSNPLANMNVKDIESVTVLKDGNSVYGSKAANGVVLIKTLRAKEMATRITANLSWGVNKKPDFPTMMDATGYKTYASDQVRGYFQFVRFVNPWEATILRLFPFLNENPLSTAYAEYHNRTDWTNEILRDGFVQDYSVGISGGGEKALFNLSMSYGTNEGVVLNTDVERFNVRFNSDIKLSGKLFSAVDLTVGKTTRNLRDDGVDNVTTPGFLALVKAPLLTPFGLIKATGERSTSLSNYDEIDPLNPLSNPRALTDLATGSSSRMNFLIRLNPYFRFNGNLLAGSVFSYGLSRLKESFFIPQKGIAPKPLSLSMGTLANEVRDLAERQTSIFSDTYVKWHTRGISLWGGFRYMTDDFEWDLPSGYNTGNDNIKVLTDGLGFRSVIGDKRQWKSMSWYASADYDYLQKYMLSPAISADASSRFGQETAGGLALGGVTWAVFPSVSGAWLASSEHFMRNLPWVDFLKLRASYGLTGNDGIDVNANRSYFRSIYYMGGLTGLQLANIQNQSVEWETSRKAGVGVDVHLFDELLLFSADVFSSRTDNLLTQKSLKDITGLSYYWSNGGALENKGFELNLRLKPVNTLFFKWELGGSVGHYKNRITALPDGDYLIEILGGTILTAVGRPAGVFYGYRTNGVFSTTEKANDLRLSKLETNGTLTPYGAGDVWFDDPDGNGVITSKSSGSVITAGGVTPLQDDRQVIGDPNPDFYGAISNRFLLGRLSIDALFTYSYGNDVYNYLRSQLESGANFYNQTTAMLNRWTTEGQITRMPRAVYGDPMGNNAFSDRWIEDGSYIRLKTLTVSYEIPVNSIFLQGVTVWASANNLFTHSKYLGADPEFSMNNGTLYQGIDAGLTPQGRSYFVGVKISL
ncbi:MAG: SusC/RagA family TonB-linked outer membrane protein [Dysgonamonadaceae bacterium]|jgi:TonB-linked SusC/RagA family outer membrane protein|nr:SusC/RagA family TonB-linked outer membrane protein [Dysgonamonadaceae bacterium]